MKKKELYVSPRIEVIEVENEGVIAASGGVSGMPGQDWGSPTTTQARRGGYSATSSDLEDMISDILTIEN